MVNYLSRQRYVLGGNIKTGGTAMNKEQLTKLESVELIDVYIATKANQRLPKHSASHHHFTVYAHGNVYLTDWGNRGKMERHMKEDYCTSLVWLRNIFYDE